MEKKSIGAFIAILRKVNGMTQRDLADRLGVSDKTVSHWELDESAPDLTLIPVIAEIFGVTCDELLRGERIKDASEEPSGKAEKQVRYLLDRSRAKFRTRSMISLGLSITGLLLAMILNFGSSSAYVAFITGCIFYSSAAICESIFYSYALYAVSGDDFKGAELNYYKMYVVRLAGKIMSVPAIMLGASLPLVLFANNAYQGVEAGPFLLCGLLGAAAAAVICMFTVYLVNNALIKKGVYTLLSGADIKRHKVNRLKVMCVTITFAILAALFIGQFVFDRIFGPEAFAAGTKFDNFDDFKAYVENGDAEAGFSNVYPQPTINPDGYFDAYGNQISNEQYFDDYGNQISKEQALADYIKGVTGYIRDDAGNAVGQYVRLNPEVASFTHSGAGTDKFSATVYTYTQMWAGDSVRNIINFVWVGSYFIAAGVGFLVYFKKRVWLG